MRIRPDIYLTADTHFGHSKMVDVWGKRESDFNEQIVKAWNSIVKSTDTVLHLGDLSMFDKKSTQDLTLRLNGQKYLVRGNHDGKSDTWFKDCGFTTLPCCYLKYKDKYEKIYHILFTHKPVDLTDIGLLGWFNIHGHLHGDNHRNDITTDHHFDVGVDAHNYKPIKLADILEEFKRVWQA